jgi:hypothetical protein
VWQDESVSEAAPTPEVPEAPGVQEPQPWHLPRLIVAWAVAAVFGVLVILLVQGPARAQWLVLAIGASAVVTFFLQLGTAQREGFITRTSFSVAGSVLIIAAIDAVSLLVG